MEINNPTKYDIFDLTELLLPEVDNKLEPYIIEIISVLGELNLIATTLRNTFRSLEMFIASFYQKTEGRHSRKNIHGVLEVVTDEENRNFIYKHHLRKEIPVLVVLINLYIKSLKTLENKIALLKNEKESLKINEGSISADKMRETSPSLLEEFNNGNWKELEKRRRVIEHRVNDINKKLLFFIENKKPNEKMNREISDLIELIEQIHEVQSEIYSIWFPKFEQYLKK